MRKKLIAVLGVGAACALLASAAFAAVQVAFNVSVSPNKANKPTGLKVKIASSDPAGEKASDGVGYPPIMNRIVIKLNAGGKYNPSKFPRCAYASLLARGPDDGCPSGAKIGTGTGRGYTSANRDPEVTGPIDPVDATLTIFNGKKIGGKDTILVYVNPDLGVQFISVGKVSKVKKGGFDYNLDFNVPPIVVVPGEKDASVGTVNTNTPKKTIKKGGRTFSLIVAPKKCTGKWKAQGEFYFEGGAKVTQPITQSCKR